jgi:hypothetical protein
MEINNNSHARDETFFERHTWKILPGLILLIGLFGVGDMFGGASELQTGETVLMHRITGMSWNELQAASPNVANLINVIYRMNGASLMVIALLGLAVCLTSFRRGERWAWIALWALPLWMVLTVYFLLAVEKQPGSGTPVPVISGSILFAISAALLGVVLSQVLSGKTGIPSRALKDDPGKDTESKVSSRLEEL